MIKSNDYPSFLSFIPKVLLAIIIPVLDTGYNEIAVWLNDMGECIQGKDNTHIEAVLRSDP